MPSVVSHREIQVDLKVTPSPPARLTGETKCWQIRDEAGTVTHCWWVAEVLITIQLPQKMVSFL